MKRKRGGQPKHWSETARVWSWYNSIKEVSDLSDYELDIKYAWKNEGRPPTTDRQRIFEWIRKQARKPRGNTDWRSINELVDYMNKEPLFKGSKELYHAELWELFKKKIITPEELNSHIDLILGSNGLVRVPIDQMSSAYLQLIKEHSLTSIYYRCLLLSMDHLNAWNMIELCWCLYVLNEPAYNWEIRATLESLLDSFFGLFFMRFIPKRHLDYYANAIDALKSTKMDSSSIDSGYGTIEETGRMVIIPKELVGKISEELLFDINLMVSGIPR